MIIPADSIFSHERGMLWTILFSVFSGGAATRFLVYVSSQMPPLPSGAGWWVQFFYKLVKGASGLDPSSTILSPKDIK